MLALTSILIRIITMRHSLFPFSSTCTTISLFCNLPSFSGVIQAYHVLLMRPNGRVRSCLFTGSVTSVWGSALSRSNLATYLLVKPISIFGFSTVTMFISSSLVLTIPSEPSPSPHDACRSPVLSRFLIALRLVHCPDSFRPRITSSHVSAGYY